MKKKLLSLALALVLCLGLTVPAFAADTLTGNELYIPGDWGSGPSLTLSGVTAERAVELELPYCYDVAVGGSLVLEMPFPAGKNRTYTIMAAGVCISSDFTEYGDNGQGWDLPAESEGGFFTEKDGKTQYVYNFTEADMGLVDGFDKAIYMDIYWDESTDPEADYAEDYGSVYFYIHVVPAEAGTPAQTVTPVQPAGLTVNPNSSTVLVNGKNVAFDAYTIEGNNYFKLRDLASVLSGTEKQFEVSWDGAANAISLTSGKGYTAVGGELAAGTAGAQTAAPTNSKILLDGQEVALTAYNVNNNNYFKLRDIGQAFDFGIGWDNASKTITIDTTTGYTA